MNQEIVTALLLIHRTLELMMDEDAKTKEIADLLKEIGDELKAVAGKV